MTTKEHLALHDKQIAQHDKQIKAMRELMHEGIRLMVETRRDLRTITAGVKRIEAALELHITGKRTNGKAPKA
jgi:hypothetical protein